MMEKVIVNVDFENNYGAYLDLLPGCVAVAHSLDGLKEDIADAIQMHLDGMKEDNDPIPMELQGAYELVFVLNIRALLHYYEGILTKAALSRITGINQRQIGHYATGHSKPREKQRERIVNGIREFGKELMLVE